MDAQRRHRIGRGDGVWIGIGGPERGLQPDWQDCELLCGQDYDSGPPKARPTLATVWYLQYSIEIGGVDNSQVQDQNFELEEDTLRTFSVFCLFLLSAVTLFGGTVTTGDLGTNIITGSTPFTVNLIATGIDFGQPADIYVKYGLWSGGTDTIDVFVNDTAIGTLTTSHGYVLPGPQYATLPFAGALLVDGSNAVKFIGQASQEYVIGKVDLNYADAGGVVVPEPNAALLVLAGIGVLAVSKRRYRQHPR